MSTHYLVNDRSNKSALSLFCLILMFISGCQTIDTSNNWPTNLPDRQLFVDVHNKSVTSGEKVIEIEPHLTWIKRFYQGTVLYPFGWNKVTNLIITSLTSQEDKNTITPRLFQLGLDISSEWAKDNSVRKINSSNIAVWGGALRRAAKEGNQLDFVSKVEQDVAAILKDELTSNDIKRARYFPAEDFDDF